MRIEPLEGHVGHIAATGAGIADANGLVLGAAAFAGGAWAGDAAPVPGGAGESASQAVALWMVGRFIGTNDGYEGHIAELQISHSGHVIAVIDGREALTGQIRGDRLFVETFEFIVTRTDEGLRTQQVGDDGNVVYYTRM